LIDRAREYEIFNKKTISDYTKAIEIDPKYAAAYYNRRNVYYCKGEYDKAWEDIHQAEKLGHKISPGFLKNLREASGRQR